MRTGSAAVANLLRRVCSETDGSAAFAVVTEEDGSRRIVAVPPPGAPGSLDAPWLEALARQVSEDPELAGDRVVVRAVHHGEPFTLSVVSMTGLSGFLAVLRGPGGSLEVAQADNLVRVASRLSRHFDTLRRLTEGKKPSNVVERTQNGPVTNVHGVASPPPITPAPTPPPPITPAEPEWPAPAEPEVYGAAQAEVSAPASPEVSGTAAEPVSEHAFAPSSAPAPAPSPAPPPGPGVRARGEDSEVVPDGSAISLWCASPDPVTGLNSPARFFSRAGQLLRAPARQSRAFVLMLVEIPNEETAASTAGAITGQLRASDPVARIDRDLFAVALLVGTGAAGGEGVEERIGSTVRGALEWLSPVRTAYVRAEPGDRRDVGELLLHAISALPGREAGSSGAPWRGAGGSAARLPFP